jgi:hypothetical protein
MTLDANDYIFRSRRGAFVLGSLTAGWEGGFSMPAAGQDKQWLKDNWAAFEEKAAAGDEEFAEMLAEVKQRMGIEGN